MAVNAKDVKNVALKGDFDDLKTASINLFIGMAERCVNESAWGCKYDDAVVMLTAHLLTVACREGIGGSLASERVGDLQVTYGAQIQSNSFYATTSYGQTFLAMMKTLTLTPFVVGC